MEVVQSKRLIACAWQFRELCRPLDKLIRRAIVWIIMMQLLALFEPYMVMHVIDGIGHGGEKMRDALLPLAGGMFLVLTVIGAIQVRKNKYIRDVWIAIEYQLPLVCGKKLLKLPLTYHQTENTGAIIGKVVRGVGKSTDLIAAILFEIAPLIIQTLATVGILAFLYWPAILVIAPVMVVFTYVTIKVKLSLADLRMKRHERDGDADDKLGQAVTNVLTTQAFAQEDREMKMVTLIRDEVEAITHQEFKRYDLSDFSRNVLISFGRVAVIYFCAKAVFGGGTSVGMLVFVYTLAEKIFISSYRISAVIDRMMDAAEPVMRMTQILAEKETILDPTGGQVVSRFNGDVQFKDVNFRYKRSTRTGEPEQRHARLALQNINLAIAAGETVGIVGESGSGKSTLVKLLMRFDDPETGSVIIDGRDLREMRMTAFRPMIGYVPQEVEIYDDTVAANIAYGNPNATREQIEDAARVANAHDFIECLEKGYDEVVGNRGLRLSGGQRQRIGIARAVLLDPPILVMDEATSHVDVVSEQKIQRAIEELRKGRTVLIIAHRLSTIQNADRIVVMEDGQVKETGSHEELLRKNGLYRRLVALQGRIEATI